MDQQTRRRHARQELTVLFGVLLAMAVALVVWAVVSRDWEQVVVSGLLCISMGVNFSVQLRKGRTAQLEGRDGATRFPEPPEPG